MATNPLLARQKALATSVERHGFQIFALNASPSLKYLTGLDFHTSERPVIFLFAPDSPPVAILPELEKGKLANLDFEVRAHMYGEDPSSWPRVFRNAAVDARLDSKRVGIEPTRMRIIELRLLENAAPRSAYIANSDVIASLRMFKDEVEIDAMRRAVHVAQEALKETLAALKEGVTEREAASELVLQLYRSGSESTLPFSPIVAFGDHSANPHAVAGDRKLAPGDLLLFDWGASVKGYASDLTRVFCYGDLDEELSRIADIVVEANAAALHAAEPGVRAGDVDRAARDIIARAGYGDAFVHRTGHGLGIECHEDPYIRADNTLPLARNMVFTIEPGVYVSGLGGVRIEDDVLVNDDGAESLSTLPRQLEQLDL